MKIEEAVNYLKILSEEKCECSVCKYSKEVYKTAVNYIEKTEEQKKGLLIETYKANDKKDKEIEELKEKNKTLETLLQGTLYEMYLYYKELASKYQANSISKDKIRAKIKELENQPKHGYSTHSDFLYESDEVIDIVIDNLKELLEEN